MIVEVFFLIGAYQQDLFNLLDLGFGYQSFFKGVDDVDLFFCVFFLFFFADLEVILQRKGQNFQVDVLVELVVEGQFYLGGGFWERIVFYGQFVVVYEVVYEFVEYGRVHYWAGFVEVIIVRFYFDLGGAVINCYAVGFQLFFWLFGDDLLFGG